MNVYEILSCDKCHEKNQSRDVSIFLRLFEAPFQRKNIKTGILWKRARQDISGKECSKQEF